MALQLALLIAVVQLASSAIIINEINADNPGTDNVEFIELHNTGNESVAMDTYTLVLYNGNGDVAYDVIRLAGESIPAKGYFVIGSSNVDPTPQFVLAGSSNLFQNGPDGIALYSGDPSLYTSDMAVTADGLVDAIVYSRSASHTAPGLTSVLTPGQDVVHEDEGFHTEDESLSRCRGTDPLMTSQFVVTYATPGSENSCNGTAAPSGETTTVASISATTVSDFSTDNPSSNAPWLLINELNSDDPGADDVEFIELQNMENRTVALDNVNIVLYNGASGNEAYDVVHLSGMSVNPRGYFVIGSANVVPLPDFVLPAERNLLQNGPDAVALHYGNPSDYVVGMAVTTSGLMDAIVYSKNDGDTAPGLTSVLTPGQDVVYEEESTYTGDESISRCGGTDAFATSQYAVAVPTPGGPNNCTATDGTNTPTTQPPQSSTPNNPTTHPVSTPDDPNHHTTANNPTTHPSTPNIPTTHPVTTTGDFDQHTTAASEQTTLFINPSTHTTTPNTPTTHPVTTPDNFNQHTTDTELGQTTLFVTTHLGYTSTMTHPRDPHMTTHSTTHGANPSTVTPTTYPPPTTHPILPATSKTTTPAFHSTSILTNDPNEATKQTTTKPLISTKRPEENPASTATTFHLSYGVTALVVVVYTAWLGFC